MTIEGTVKANDSAAYASFEESFSLLTDAAETGSAAKGQSAAAAVTKAVAAYLATYPG